MTKRETLEAIDTELATRILAALQKGDTEELSNLNPVISYLKNNQVLTPPEKDKGMNEKVKEALVS